MPFIRSGLEREKHWRPAGLTDASANGKVRQAVDLIAA